MDAKECSKCKEVKALSEFNLDKNGIAGVRAQCKVCQYTIQKTRYKREFYKAQAKEKARDAFRAGKLQKPFFCELCGERKRLDRHHSDYSKPLKIVWVCRKCHSKLKSA